MMAGHSHIKGKHLHLQACAYAESRNDITVVGAHIAGCFIVISQSNIKVFAEKIFGTKDEVSEEMLKEVVIYNNTITVGG